MRKTLFVLIMLLAVGMLSAATSVTLESSEESGEANLKIVLPLKSGGQGFEFITVGFTNTAVSPATTGSLSEVTPLDVEQLTLNADGDNSASITDGLYAYWQLRTSDTVNVTLKKGGQLTGATTAEKIDWKITADSAGSQEMTDYDNAIKLVEDWTAGEGEVFNQGSAKITVETDKYEGKATDDYSANLVLTVTAVGA